MLSRSLLLAAILLPGTLRAQEPATVDVRVELVLPRYRDRFQDSVGVRAKAAEIFADYLRERVGFLRFAVNNTTAPYRLSFLLDRQDRSSATSFAEVGFWVRLEHTGDEAKEKYWLPLRTGDQSLSGVGNEAGFLTEIKTKLSHQDPELVRKEILRWVPFTDTGLPTLDPIGVVLPFSAVDLCMQNESEVQFVAEIRGTNTTEEPFTARVAGAFKAPEPRTPEIGRYDGDVLAKLIDPGAQGALSASIGRNAVTVKRVFVTLYVHNATACSNRRPLDVGSGTP